MNAIERLTKLAELSDLLDSNGEHEAANEVDRFMQRFAEDEGIVIPQETLENMLENVETINYNIEETINFLKSQGYDVSGPEVQHEDIAAGLSPMFQKLSHIADSLDEFGERVGADLIDQFLIRHATEEDIKQNPVKTSDWNDSLPGVVKLADPVLPDEVDWKDEADTEQSKRYDDRHHHNLQVREPKRDQEKSDKESKEHHISTYHLSGTHALQTRHCPDHLGEQLGRVGEGVYQCPRDGTVYNWATGFKTMDGEEVPGGSIAAQTPDSTGYATPIRMFDSRQNVINTIN